MSKNSDLSKSQIYRDARDLGFSRSQSAILVWQSTEPGDFEPDEDSVKDPEEVAEEIILMLQVLLIVLLVLILSFLDWLSRGNLRRKMGWEDE